MHVPLGAELICWKPLGPAMRPRAILGQRLGVAGFAISLFVGHQHCRRSGEAQAQVLDVSPAAQAEAPLLEPRCGGLASSAPAGLCLRGAPWSGRERGAGFAPWRGHRAETQSAFCGLCALLSRRSVQSMGGGTQGSSAASRRLWMGEEGQVSWHVSSVGVGPRGKGWKRTEMLLVCPCRRVSATSQTPTSLSTRRHCPPPRGP